ncbi:MAG: hypothetical protein IT184_05630 [Acidobacteria bacterium]|nr:hypothetical protein [Acidobacteriota bacterium]
MRNRLEAGALALVAVVGPLVLFMGTPGTSDVDIWFKWAQILRTSGPVSGFAALRADYPPGSSLVLLGVRYLSETLSIPYALGLKITLTLCLAATACVVFLVARSVLLVVATVVSMSLNAVALMYLDVLMAPFLLAAAYVARRGRWCACLALLICASYFKYQPVVLLPFALVFSLRNIRTKVPRGDWILLGAAAGGVVAGLAVYGVEPVWRSFITASRHNTLSSFAANPQWILTWILQAWSGRATEIVEIVSASRPTLRVLSLVSLVGYGYVLRAYWKSGDGSNEGFLRFGLLGFLVYFFCSAGVHENHLFVPLVMTLSLAIESERWWPQFVVVAAAANANLLGFYGWTGYLDRGVTVIDNTVWLACVASIALFLVGKSVWRGDGSGLSKRHSRPSV